MNIDKIKEDLHIFKDSFRTELSTEEEKELNEFIDNLMKSIQAKTDKINVENLTLAMKKYISELGNG